ncbi:hypothetical protein GCM10010266_70110 [Streptomyces griseomycini]|nr:hypothetical protein GCM10010266_70110 [Streptomyces griseomycini]
MSEALVALAAAGGTAVVQAAGTDAWTQLRTRVARLVGRGRTEEERRALVRLDRMADDLADADPEDIGALRARHEGAWQERLELLLDAVPDDERESVAAEIRSLIDELPQRRTAERNRFEISGGHFYSPVQMAENIHGTTFHMGPVTPSNSSAHASAASSPQQDDEDGRNDRGR